MGVLEDLADKLAEETMELSAELGDDEIFEEISKIIGATSTTLQETYLTSIRLRTAAARGHEALANIAAQRKAGSEPSA